MAKDKKKHSKKDRVSEDLLDAAALSLKKFRKVTKQLTKLSTGQKVMGGIALLAAGFTYLANNKADESESKAIAPTGADPLADAHNTYAEEVAPASALAVPSKSRKKKPVGGQG